eukprot:CAMPEP_0178800090 /NCGR_PEP_ID=MMETSP0745-20121128/12648_1 /TAXON_ID=913974 /ORGANISM="Nitzschia punctata, Strain CCMP561" /LENGTH=63 /DNA_ID=CAMNT_0020458875 /DNA_START=1016 /DNA_END=1207 /DNA_ORIENTATION=-
MSWATITDVTLAVAPIEVAPINMESVTVRLCVAAIIVGPLDSNSIVAVAFTTVGGTALFTIVT